MIQPRLRIFAGPNGSGKSTLNAILGDEMIWIYINADDMEKNINQLGYLNFDNYSLKVIKKDLFDFLLKHPLINKANLTNKINELEFNDNKLIFSKIKLNSYYTSVCADYIRHQLLSKKVSFTFETVMSYPDKIDFMAKAKKNGYRIYLYYISTEDPIINISRVKNRVNKGGHTVPEDKIEDRYYRSLELLRKAVENTDRAYIFDNSKSDKVWLAEITDAQNINLKVDTIPYWLNKYLIDI